MTLWKSENLPGDEMPAQRNGKAFIAGMSDDELRSLAREKLSEALQFIDPATQPELTRKLCAEVKDRLDGRPAQQMVIDQNLNVVTVNAQISFVKPQPMLDNTGGGIVIDGNTIG